MDLGFRTKGVAYFDLLFSIRYNGTPVRSPAPLTLYKSSKTCPRRLSNAEILAGKIQKAA